LLYIEGARSWCGYKQNIVGGDGNRSVSSYLIVVKKRVEFYYFLLLGYSLGMCM
jgi:hypothetical protein